ncbi:cupin domain-containing protein [Herbaspirillum sp. NPDC101396]|uniref:cupin domain-containing protein n=1 Tax=Herbaspirillum sp. NPDC101396 TaxID=3364005 RepID=UPI00383BB761
MNLPLPSLPTRRHGYRLVLLGAVGALLMTQSPVPQAAGRWIADICIGAGADVLPFSSAPLAATGGGGVTTPGTAAATSVKVISCEPLPNAPGKSITTMMVDFPPLAYSAPHRHPGSVTAIVIEGTVRSQMEGGPVVNYQKGQTWMEAPYALHAMAGNPDPAKPAQLLAIFVTDSNCGPLVIPEPALKN